MDKGTYGRKDRLIQEWRHDAYRNREKLPEPSLCSECKALFVNGRWTWNVPETDTHDVLCPACKRIADKYPAGTIEIRGDFYTQHRLQITNLINNVEKQEKDERPLERIMDSTDRDDGTLITTTGVHLARRIGEALSNSYQGDFAFQYAEGDKKIRVQWQR